MTLPPLEGHAEEQAALAAAVAAHQLPNSLLFHGPPGIGKQRLALWLAQLLLCTRRQPAAPCADCHACRLATRLEHPDLHWYFPLLRPKGASADRLGDALEEARAAELSARRADPLRPTVRDGMAGIFIAHVHVLLRAAATRPAMGARKVFVIGDAEGLVPQEASPDAANALLKLLEEPPHDTTIILTAADPELLLPTIRSRLLPLRMRPLPEPTVAAFLVERAGTSPADAQRAARLGQGAIGRALAFLPRDGEPGPLEALRSSARSMLEAALAADPAPRFAAALAESPAGARGAFSDTLDFLILWLRDLAAASAGADDLLVNRDAADWLRTHAARHPRVLTGLAPAIREVEATLQSAQVNINPQLALAGLLRRIHRHMQAS